MSIRTRAPGQVWPPSRRQRKIDQAWEMAGLARQDGDQKDADKWTAEARRLQTCAEEDI